MSEFRVQPYGEHVVGKEFFAELMASLPELFFNDVRARGTTIPKGHPEQNIQAALYYTVGKALEACGVVPREEGSE